MNLGRRSLITLTRMILNTIRVIKLIVALIVFSVSILYRYSIISGNENYSNSYVYRAIYGNESQNSSKNEVSKLRTNTKSNNLTIRESSNVLEVTQKYKHLWVQRKNYYGLN